MINEKRVILETRLAVYESRSEADDKINSYYKSDYVTGHLLVTFLCATLAFLLIAGVYAFYHLQDVMLQIYNESIAAMIFTVIVYYVVFVAVLLVLTFLIYTWRYNKAGERLDAFYGGLRELAVNYKREEER